MIADLGLIDLDSGCSIVCPVLLDGNLAELAGQLGEMVEHPNQIHPNPGPRTRGSPCRRTLARLVVDRFRAYLQLVAHVVLYAVHLFAHVLSVLVDPADPNLRRKDSKRPVPKFNRSEHAHVIENGHCHLCDIDISSQACKHIHSHSLIDPRNMRPA